jgi:H+-transporting ATPase
VRRGQATAEVVAIGADTRFGRGAELIRIAHVGSTEQRAIFRVVRNLAVFNGGVTALLIVYAFLLQLPITQILPLAVVAVLASIPVALPFMFTLAATIGARALAGRGVLPTRLSSLHEAAGRPPRERWPLRTSPSSRSNRSIRCARCRPQSWKHPTG